MNAALCIKLEVSEIEMECNCGVISFLPEAKPFSRFVCHCDLCQAYMGQDYNDESFFLESQVSIVKPEQIEFRKNYSAKSPLSRGTCKICKKPVVSIAKSPIHKFILVPSELALTHNVELPSVCAHVFYHRRKVELNDQTPKYRGFWKSQIMTQWHLFKGLVTREKNA